MSHKMSHQADYEAATLGRYLQECDADESASEAVERELEILYSQTVGDLIRATPDGWCQRLDDVLNEIAEALVYRRRTML